MRTDQKNWYEDNDDQPTFFFFNCIENFGRTWSSRLRHQAVSDWGDTAWPQDISALRMSGSSSKAKSYNTASTDALKTLKHKVLSKSLAYILAYNSFQFFKVSHFNLSVHKLPATEMFGKKTYLCHLSVWQISASHHSRRTVRCFGCLASWRSLLVQFVWSNYKHEWESWRVDQYFTCEVNQ